MEERPGNLFITRGMCAQTLQPLNTVLLPREIQGLLHVGQHAARDPLALAHPWEPSLSHLCAVALCDTAVAEAFIGK